MSLARSNARHVVVLAQPGEVGVEFLHSLLVRLEQFRSGAGGFCQLKELQDTWLVADGWRAEIK